MAKIKFCFVSRFLFFCVMDVRYGRTTDAYVHNKIQYTPLYAILSAVPIIAKIEIGF